MIGRVIWTGIIAAIAIVTGLAQLDRSSRLNPALSALVPAPFQGFAARHLAGFALLASESDGSFEAAHDKARHLVKVRPLPAEHLTLLAQSASKAGHQERALAALEAATTRGWRDPLAQQAAMQSALLQGDFVAASQRVSALLATGLYPEQTQVLLGQLLDQEGGRVALVKQFAEEGRWQRNATLQIASAANPESLARFITLANAQGVELDCAHIVPIVQGYEQEAILAPELRPAMPTYCGV